jgi:hypothetical protein
MRGSGRLSYIVYDSPAGGGEAVPADRPDTLYSTTGFRGNRPLPHCPVFAVDGMVPAMIEGVPMSE